MWFCTNFGSGNRQDYLPLETSILNLFSSEMGRLENTGVETDIAVLKAEGYFYIQPENGQIA